jgi:hypothetical protein
MFVAGARAGVGHVANFAAEHRINIQAQDDISDLDSWAEAYGGDPEVIGVFRRVPPSKYQPRAVRGSGTQTAGNTAGIAAEARTCSSCNAVAT